MASPTEAEIKATAQLLEKVLGCSIVSQPILTPTMTGDSNHRGVPSVQSCYNAFEGLPNDHPIKTEVNPMNVMLGYYGLEALQFDPSRNYQELAAVLVIAPKQ